MQHVVSQDRVARGWVGVLVRDLPKDPQKWHGYDSTAGALVGGVVHDGPADEAGLGDGDIIVKLTDRPVANARHLGDMIAATRPGTELTLIVFRAGRLEPLRIVIGQFDVPQAAVSSSGLTSDLAATAIRPASELPSRRSSHSAEEATPAQSASHAAA